MQRNREPLIFAATFLVYSAVLGWLFWSSTSYLGEYSLERALLAVPVVSVMLAARGYVWKRKLVYAAMTVAVYVLARSVARVTGLDAFAAQELNTVGGFPSIGTMLYLAFLSAFPLAMLVLFVGRTPTLLWQAHD